MKSLLVLCMVVIAVSAVARPQAKYTDKYDSMNLDEIMGNRRLLVAYILCALDQGRCTPEGNELKSHISEALENNCAKCTDTQKKSSRRIIEHLINNEPGYWKDLCKKYDPTGKYSKKYEKELKKVA